VDAEDPAEDGPTEAEVAADRELAIQVVVATLSGVAVLGGTAAGILGAGAAPMALAIAHAAVKRLGGRRAEHAADTLLDAAEAASLSLDDFLDGAVSDDRRHELFARTLRIAQDTARRDKRRALGRALAAGVMGDDARIDEEMLFIRAVDDIDEMHIRLLARLALPAGAWTAPSIVQADPGLAGGVHALLGTLESHGLIESSRPVPPGGASRGQAIYHITGSGQAFLARLADDAG